MNNIIDIVKLGIDATPFLGPVSRPTAYLDPGSGSYLLQLLIAGLLGSAFVIRASWGKIKAYFRRVSKGEEIETEDDQE
jgi:hypothetical protein